jgi:uncharacterized pyridoxamine 5'-phosphate oxidase family protein
MLLTLKQIKFIQKNEEVIFATASDDMQPRAIVVLPSIIETDRIILSNVQMTRSVRNLLANPKVFILSSDGSRQIKISGVAKYLTKGDLFDEVKIFEKDRGVKVRGIIDVAQLKIEETNE